MRHYPETTMIRPPQFTHQTYNSVFTKTVCPICCIKQAAGLVHNLQSCPQVHSCIVPAKFSRWALYTQILWLLLIFMTFHNIPKLHHSLFCQSGAYKAAVGYDPDTQSDPSFRCHLLTSIISYASDVAGHIKKTICSTYHDRGELEGCVN